MFSMKVIDHLSWAPSVTRSHVCHTESTIDSVHIFGADEGMKMHQKSATRKRHSFVQIVKLSGTIGLIATAYLL